MTIITQTIRSLYPLAAECQHKSSHDSMFQEQADDRYYYIIINRCNECGFPLGERDASNEEVEAFLNEK